MSVRDHGRIGQASQRSNPAADMDVVSRLKSAFRAIKPGLFSPYSIYG